MALYQYAAREVEFRVRACPLQTYERHLPHPSPAIHSLKTKNMLELCRQFVEILGLEYPRKAKLVNGFLNNYRIDFCSPFIMPMLFVYLFIFRLDVHSAWTLHLGCFFFITHTLGLSFDIKQ